MTVSIAAICALLFLLLFASIYTGMQLWLARTMRQRRLENRRIQGRLEQEEEADRPVPVYGKLHAHVADLLAAVSWSISPSSFLSGALFAACVGFAGGAALFESYSSACLFALILGSIPYIVLRMKLVSLQLATRLEFLPAVELFYHCYLITGCRHVRTALQKTVDERRLPGEVQAVFAQLCRQLSVRDTYDDSLRRFSLAFGHMWADYFASILKVALAEGHDVSGNLKDLISDMRKAQLANQQERHRLLEIRIANFTPALFLALFLGVNFRLNYEASYRYYLLESSGRGMLLNAVALLFGSLLMGIYLSRKKF